MAKFIGQSQRHLPFFQLAALLLQTLHLVLIFGFFAASFVELFEGAHEFTFSGLHFFGVGLDLRGQSGVQEARIAKITLQRFFRRGQLKQKSKGKN